MNFGEKLKYLREKHGLTQEELGKLVNLTKGNISKYERNTHQPNFDTLTFFADYFCVSLDYLLGRVEYRNTPSKESKVDPIGKSIEYLSEESKEDLEEYIELLQLREMKKRNRDEIGRKRVE